MGRGEGVLSGGSDHHNTNVNNQNPNTTQVWDIARERLTHTCSHHTKGVHSFVWCKAYSLFASCGIERGVTIWQVGGCLGEGIGVLLGWCQGE